MRGLLLCGLLAGVVAGCCGGVMCPSNSTCVNNQCVTTCSLSTVVKPPLVDGSGQRVAPAPPAGAATVIAEARATYLLAVLQNLARHEYTEAKCRVSASVSE